MEAIVLKNKRIKFFTHKVIRNLTPHEAISFGNNEHEHAVVMQITAEIVGQVYFAFLREDLEKVAFDESPCALQCHQRKGRQGDERRC